MYCKKLSAWTTLLLLSACGSSLDGTTSTDPTADDTKAVTNTSNVTVDWGTDDSVASGVVTSSLSMTGYVMDGTEGNFPTCFDNNRSCRKAASAVQDVILNNPVLVQAFQLNFTKTDASGNGGSGQWSSMSLTAASVTTAEIRFDGTTGALKMNTAYTKQLVSGATCTLGSSNTVGYASTAGSEKLLVGMRFFEEATQMQSSSNSYTNAYMSAARVWHSGIYPVGAGTASSIFNFSFEPVTDAATADFGINSFTESSSASTLVSPKFGVDSSDASSISGNYKNHVVIGFCIQGTKTGSSSRPILYFSRAYVRRPTLKKL